MTAHQAPLSLGFSRQEHCEWVAISFSNAWKWKVKVKSLSRVRPSATYGLQPTRLLRLWDFPGKSAGVGCYPLLRNGILLRRKKEQNFSICSHMKGLGGHRAYWTKSGRERQIPYGSTYLWNLKKYDKLVNTTKRSRLTDGEQTGGYQLRGQNRGGEVEGTNHWKWSRR